MLDALYDELLKGEVQWQPVSRKEIVNFVFDRAYRLGMEAAKKQPWISVNEQLPEDDSYFYFLADVRLDPIGVDCAEYNCETKLFSRNGNILHPTHWMHIPEITGKEFFNESNGGNNGNGLYVKLSK